MPRETDLLRSPAEMALELQRDGALERLRDRLRIYKMQTGLSYEKLARHIPLVVAENAAGFAQVLGSRQSLFEFLRPDRPTTPSNGYLALFHAFLLLEDSAYRHMCAETELVREAGGALSSWMADSNVGVQAMKSTLPLPGEYAWEQPEVTNFKRMSEPDDFDSVMGFAFRAPKSGNFLLAYRVYITSRGQPNLDAAMGFVVPTATAGESFLLLRDAKWGRAISYTLSDRPMDNGESDAWSLELRSSYTAFGEDKSSIGHRRVTTLTRAPAGRSNPVSEIVDKFEWGRDLWQDR